MGRIANAWSALRGKEGLPDATQSVTIDHPNDTPFSNTQVRRDKPIGHTSAPPGSRQQWQLHRAREESRDLELTSPLWRSYVWFSKIQVRGYELSRLTYEGLTKEQTARLKDVLKHMRWQWARFQNIKGLGGTGQSVHQMAGSALYHMTVDGDCFLLPRMRNDKRVWDLHPGDALAEQEYQVSMTGPSIFLGVEVDQYSMPLAYRFGAGGKLARLNYGYWSYGSAGTDIVVVPASRVSHIRDRSGEVTAVRGWPLCTAVVEDISRLDDWYSSLVRSAITRASVAIALEKSDMFGSADLTGTGRASIGQQSRSVVAADGAADQQGGRQLSERVKRYQEYATEAGSLLELLPGYKPHSIDTGSPSAQEATLMRQLEQRVCSGLRTTPATLLGDYSQVNFSASQSALGQEREAIRDRQQVLITYFYEPVFRDWLMRNWQDLVGTFREIDPVKDMKVLLYPDLKLRTYQVIDKQRLVGPLLKAWEKGLMTWPEVRSELGYMVSDPDSVIEEWKENRRALGLPDTPTQTKMTRQTNEDKGETNAD